jgi:hypothetical protein
MCRVRYEATNKIVVFLIEQKGGLVVLGGTRWSSVGPPRSALPREWYSQVVSVVLSVVSVVWVVFGGPPAHSGVHSSVVFGGLECTPSVVSVVKGCTPWGSALGP